MGCEVVKAGDRHSARLWQISYRSDEAANSPHASFAALVTYDTYVQDPHSLVFSFYSAPSSLSFAIIPSTSSTLPPPCRAGGSATLIVFNLFPPSSIP